MKQFSTYVAALLMLSACGGGNMPPPPAADIKPDRHLTSLADAGCATVTNADGTVSSADDCGAGGGNDFGTDDEGAWGNGSPPSDGDDQLPDIDQAYDYGSTPGGDGSYYAGGTGNDDGLDYLYYYHVTPAEEQLAVREGCYKTPSGMVCGITGKRPDPFAEPDPLPKSHPPVFPVRVEIPFRACHLLGMYGCDGGIFASAQDALGGKKKLTAEEEKACTDKFNAGESACFKTAKFHRSHVTLKGCLDDVRNAYGNCLAGKPNPKDDGLWSAPGKIARGQ